ncbi:MAG: histidine phosphatase family protein [Planctomycetes bacterium]|nr:histidine phosphatase family protein [Planctomycetota bacterium]
MRTLLLMRHAKSGWDDSGLRDHDRPLNARGESAAPRMGRLLAELGRVPDRVLCSTAVRARRSAELLVEAAGIAIARLHLLEDLYLAPPSVILEAVARRGGDAATLLVVGHNPGIEELVASLARHPEACPTATIAAFRLGIDEWQEAMLDMEAEELGIWRPKELEP